MMVQVDIEKLKQWKSDLERSIKDPTDLSKPFAESVHQELEELVNRFDEEEG